MRKLRKELSPKIVTLLSVSQSHDIFIQTAFGRAERRFLRARRPKFYRGNRKGFENKIMKWRQAMVVKKGSQWKEAFFISSLSTFKALKRKFQQKHIFLLNLENSKFSGIVVNVKFCL